MKSTGERPRYPPWIAEELASGSTTGGRHHSDGGRRRGRRRRRKKGVRMSSLRRLRRLLLSVTQCPIRWSWRDVGVRFWPRWVKEGRCGEASKEETRKEHRKRKGRKALGRRRKGEGKKGNSTAMWEEGRKGKRGGEEGEKAEGDVKMEGSCSIPPGMVCRASRARSITLLRWHCKEWGPDEGESGTKEPESVREQMNCRWIKVQYPIVTRCACVCPD
ncbi:hypothetical protein J437_LFUL002941 [Ladona fulva]|uniref:Uncharacterized protein n=1 Tax=Ladona fulva TaxID=123851 RepID=A0A8K0KB52_LADFU|nr:hypothetical protein J437_LFUL002941 [Ladona fulva]